MKSAWMAAVAGWAVALGAGACAVWAEEPAKTLPTLLIKGEVVSLDTADSQATLVKVRDRYGFETPIFVTAESKVTQADAAIPIAEVTAGASVEVEYNFDVNTAKRHAVSVKVSQAAPAAATTPSSQSLTPTPVETAAPAEQAAAPPAATEPAAAPQEAAQPPQAEAPAPAAAQ